MGDLSDYRITREVLQEMYDKWCAGEKKSVLERRYLDKPERKSHLTAERDELAREVSRLQALLRQHGIDPTSRT